MTDLVHIALASNRRYLPGLRATLVSLVRASSEPLRLRFHIFSDGLTDGDKDEVRNLLHRFDYNETVEFLTPDMDPIKRSFKAYNGSYTAFLRLFFPDMLPDLKWVLWTDVDVLWFRDPLRFWEERDESVSVVWSPDIPSTKKATFRQFVKWHPDFDLERYACSGVMLMNLQRMRANNLVSRAVSFVDHWGSPFFADQDVFNELCYDDAKLVDRRWDLLYPVDDVGDGVVVHFNGIGPKFNDAEFSGWSPLYEIWFRFVAHVVDDGPKGPVCSPFKRLFFLCLSTLYPMRRVIACCTGWIHPWVADFIQRNLLFAWLRRKQLWRI